MKSMLVAAMLLGAAVPAMCGEITVRRVQGDVAVRNGVLEEWVPLKAGSKLVPDASIRTGDRSTILLVTGSGKDKGGQRDISVPAEVILDVADIRDLTREELMLKLTMQKVRSSPYQWKGTEPAPTGTTVVHGTDNGAAGGMGENDPAVGVLMLNGARVLFENGFYSTSALRALDVFRRHPGLAARFPDRWMVAEALERAQLRGEALSEYTGLGREEFLTDAEREKVKGKVEMMKQVKSGE